ncbi:tetratricopeptide repeat protein [Microbacterium sp.]|uniref:tetratricopeptide repeat protein n=1 Tax=Microbacterium sp. TaxID=51671 RepID=UPI002736EAA5|nr:tetratricopeptide repeat protein [Microbacterium sp.]MDP3950862.1 tetratricopeptide repeat protein [Microbacterium sp.]MDZ4247957.1 tetratricopeptide repeat protein [Patescibacteria group bacterium]
MRFYRRQTKEDLGLGARHCDFDAKDGRVALALLRLDDLRQDFPGHRDLDFLEAEIRWEMLGQGRVAHQMYEDIVRDTTADKQTRISAVRNATLSAPTAAAFAKLNEEATRLDPSFRIPADVRRMFRDDRSSAIRLHDTAAELQQAGKHGVSAAFADMALGTGSFTGQDEISLRKSRAQSLRQVDHAAAAHREVLAESFPPDERLALSEALGELDRALALDEWDAELWNFRAAWCYLLRRFDEVISAADRAIELRTSGYAKPYYNRGIALKALCRADEALVMFQRSIEEARRTDSQQDVDLANQAIAMLSQQPVVPSVDNLAKGIVRVTKDSAITSQRLFATFYVGQAANVPSLARSIRDRILVVAGNQWSMGYVLVLDELLGDMGPEASFQLLIEMGTDARHVFENFCRAALYVAAQGEGASQRDAARLVLLIVLAPERPDEIKSLFRRMVLATSAVSPGALTKLGKVMTEEVARVSPALADFLTDQPSVNANEREQAENIVRELSGPIPSVPYLTEYSGSPQRSPRAATVFGCLTVLGLLAAVVALAWWLLH